jgi:hypothetical protein
VPGPRPAARESVIAIITIVDWAWKHIWERSVKTEKPAKTVKTGAVLVHHSKARSASLERLCKLKGAIPYDGQVPATRILREAEPNRTKKRGSR